MILLREGRWLMDRLPRHAGVVNSAALSAQNSIHGERGLSASEPCLGWRVWEAVVVSEGADHPRSA